MTAQRRGASPLGRPEHRWQSSCWWDPGGGRREGQLGPTQRPCGRGRAAVPPPGLACRTEDVDQCCGCPGQAPRHLAFSCRPELSANRWVWGCPGEAQNTLVAESLLGTETLIPPGGMRKKEGSQNQGSEPAVRTARFLLPGPRRSLPNVSLPLGGGCVSEELQRETRSVPDTRALTTLPAEPRGPSREHATRKSHCEAVATCWLRLASRAACVTPLRSRERTADAPDPAPGSQHATC